MAKKINVDAIKEFMFNHGEKVALGTCVFLALTFGGWGLWGSLSAGTGPSGKKWSEELKGATQGINNKANALSAPDVPKEVLDKIDDPRHWRHLNMPFDQTPYISLPPDRGSKRGNPQVLAIKEQKLNDKDAPKNIHLDYIRGLVWVHDGMPNSLRCFADSGAAAGGGGGVVPPVPPRGMGPGAGIGQQAATLPEVVKAAGKVHRMVLVTGRFPMKQQMEEFQRAMKMFSQKDMLIDNRDDLPFSPGIDVYKFEIVNGKKVNENGELLMAYDPKTGQILKGKALDELLRIAIYDEEAAKAMKPYLFHGLSTPLPKLGSARYPNADGHYPAYEIKQDDNKNDLGLVRLPDEEPDAKKTDVGSGVGVGPMPMPMGKGGPPPGGGSGGVIIPGKGKDKEKAEAAKETPLAVVPDRKIKDLKPIEVKEADKPLYKRLFDKDRAYNIYHAMGLPVPPKGAAPKDGGGFKPNIGMQNPGGAAANNQGDYFDPWDIDPPVGGAAGPGGGPVGGSGVGGPPPVGGSGGGPPPMPKGGGPPMMPPVGGGENQAMTWERDAVVRFLDVDVVPGKTYQYAIRVRMNNPNHKKPDQVAFADLAVPAELPPSAWVHTPTITIPHEHYLYAFDQHLANEWATPPTPMAVKKKPLSPKDDPFYLAKDQTTFQIHQWKNVVPNAGANGAPLTIGDWAIAERVVVRRGETIGTGAWVFAPAWYKDKNVFDLPITTLITMLEKGKKDIKIKTGLAMDFMKEADRPVLVDFSGGKRPKVLNVSIEEDVAVEALILTPDGKLSVLNSRDAADATQPDLPGPVTRAQRVETSRHNVTAVQTQNANPGTGDPKGPMNPMNPKGGPPPIPGR